MTQSTYKLQGELIRQLRGLLAAWEKWLEEQKQEQKEAEKVDKRLNNQ